MHHEQQAYIVSLSIWILRVRVWAGRYYAARPARL